MSEATNNGPIPSAFVTGATGLLGNNLVRLLVSRGVRVRALARSREKAAKQFASLPIETVVGDMSNVRAFASALEGLDAIFHTAAFFRDNYKGGKHWKELYDANVAGTSDLLFCAHGARVRRFVHTSSVGVLTGRRGQLIDETMLRTAKDADDYYLSKILSDRAVEAFLGKHPDMWASMVLPGWMVGPGDLGPTSSGQVILDYLDQKLPEFLRRHSLSSMLGMLPKRTGALLREAAAASAIWPRDATCPWANCSVFSSESPELRRRASRFPFPCSSRSLERTNSGAA